MDDPIIPAFNTPEHKFNISVSGRDIFNKFGFNINYKWIEGFIFEGSHFEIFCENFTEQVKHGGLHKWNKTNIVGREETKIRMTIEERK